MTIIKVLNHYLSFPEKNDSAKDAFAALLSKYILDEMDADSSFDINLFVEYILEENDKIESLDTSEVDDDKIFFEYDETILENLISEILEDEDDEDDAGDVEFYYNQDEEEEDSNE
jgi:prenyltransferase beta subunit